VLRGRGILVHSSHLPALVSLALALGAVAPQPAVWGAVWQQSCSHVCWGFWHAEWMYATDRCNTDCDQLSPSPLAMARQSWHASRV